MVGDSVLASITVEFCGFSFKPLEDCCGSELSRFTPDSQPFAGHAGQIGRDQSSSATVTMTEEKRAKEQREETTRKL